MTVLAYQLEIVPALDELLPLFNEWPGLLVLDSAKTSSLLRRPKQYPWRVPAMMSSQPSTSKLLRSSTTLAAALRVNVTAKIRLASAPSSNSRAILRFMANDLPVPGPAITRKGVSGVDAICSAVPVRPSFQGIIVSWFDLKSESPRSAPSVAANRAGWRGSGIRCG